MATTSCVNWPQDWEDSGEGGLVVYFAALDSDDEPFVKCFAESVITMSHPDVEVSGHSARVWPEIDWDRAADFPASYGLLAAICVDSTTSSWWSDDTEGRYFAPGRDDLTDLGNQLYDNLQALYGREVLIITLLDT